MKAEGEALRVLLTGATGFLGKYVSRELRAAGADVTETSKSLGYDLRNESEAMTCVWLSRPDVVVHLAKSPLLPAESGAFSFRDTLLMGMNVIHSAALARAKVILVVPPTLHDKESYNGEAEAKKALMAALKGYESQFGIDSLVLQFSELYGPFSKAQDGYLDPQSLINIFTLARLQAEKHVILPGTGQEMRRLLAVHDAAKAVAKACMMGPVEGVITMSGKEVISENTLAEAVFKACRFEGSFEWDGENSLFAAPSILSNGNAKEILGITADTAMEQVLGAMVAIRMEGLPVIKSTEESH